MAEIIQIHEFQAARRRNSRRDREQQNIERALEIMRANLAHTANDLLTAPIAAQPELLERIERLAALIRYGIRMAGAAASPEDAPGGASGAGDR